MQRAIPWLAWPAALALSLSCLALAGWGVWLAISTRAQEAIPIPENSLDTPDWLRSLLPTGIRIQTLESKDKSRKADPASQSLFKDGIFGNRFHNLIVQKDGTAAFGFHPRNAVAIGKTPEKAFALLLPFLRWEGATVSGGWTEWSGKAANPPSCPIPPPPL